MFYSREKELMLLENAFKKGNNAIALYGKRRVGKTSLIKQANKGNSIFIYFECLRDDEETNVLLFKKECEKNGVVFPTYFHADKFISIFEYLNSLSNSYVVAIDEYPYLKELINSQSIDSEFQNIIDNYLRNITLIISGSQIKMMEDVLSEGNPLFGRFSETIYLEELNYKEVSNFYPNKSIYDKIAFFSVFAGSPYVNESIDPKKNLKENIINTLLRPGSTVYNYAENVLLSDVANKLHARRILNVIGNSKKKRKEITDILDKNKTGVINRSLLSLVELKIVKRTEPINKIGDDKKASYEISDNVLRFFYTYVYNNKSQLEALGPNAFYDEYIASSIETFISLRFENQVKQYFSLQIKEGKLLGVRNIGSYYYDDPVNRTNGEFDVVLETNNGFDIYEVKYLKNPLKESVIRDEISQINKIQEIDVHGIGFVSASGFEKKVYDYIYIDGKDLY